MINQQVGQLNHLGTPSCISNFPTLAPSCLVQRILNFRGLPGGHYWFYRQIKLAQRIQRTQLLSRYHIGILPLS